jgi:hypothetical protein
VSSADDVEKEMTTMAKYANPVALAALSTADTSDSSWTLDDEAKARLDAGLPVLMPDEIARRFNSDHGYTD